MTTIELIEERVTFQPDTGSSDVARYLPNILVTNKSSGTHTERSFETNDMCRVLDFDKINDPPPDGPMLHCESKNTSVSEALKFPVRHFCLRGNYLFYFALQDVDDETSNDITYLGPPLGVVPLNQTSVEFPPGGRRVFREHAHTDARNGYEFVIIHAPDEENANTTRPVEFVVAESLNQRERWATAIRLRSELPKATMLRPDTGENNLGKNKKEKKTKKDNVAALSALTEIVEVGGGGGPPSSNKKEKKKKRRGGDKDKDKKGSAPSGKGGPNEMFNDDIDVSNAIQEFGSAPNNQKFNEEEWVNKYYEKHSDFDGPTKCRQLDTWQSSIKKGLKGAVLEQYEYFVEASGEMTTMGREVTTLKNLIESQVETIKEMKEIDFSINVNTGLPGAGGGIGVGGSGPQAIGGIGDDVESSDEEGGPPGTPKARRRSTMRKRQQQGAQKDGADGDDMSSVSSSEGKGGGKGGKRKSGKGSKSKKKASSSDNKGEFRDEEHYDETMLIDVPTWLDDVTEEITAFIKECRYTDATDLVFKAKNEVNDILSQHEKPTERRLTKKQYTNMHSILQGIDGLIANLSNRLVEGLRRKNEALKQAAKRERSDPLSLMAPMVSPTCLNDDAIPLQLLVKLNKTQDAANAYAARRSLLLMEALHERPISGTGTVDLVIYSAQLSQSFFSCLASAVEGFLDLFLQTDHGLHNSSSGLMTMSSPKQHHQLGIDENSLDDSSMQSSMQGGSTKNVPPGALSAIVLWCDSELSKFSSAFGGTRILGNLALSPPPRDQQLQQHDTRRNSNSRFDETGGGGGSYDNTKERQSAIEVAAACVDQAFQYASQNLDSIGLPLTPRLAEYIRSRLKGCEGEVAKLLNTKWKHLAFDWEFDMEFGGGDDQPMDERRSGLRAPPRQ